MFVLGIVVYLVTVAIGAFWGGFVLTKLWFWFVVPTFHLPLLTLPSAIGLSLVVSYMTSRPDFSVSEQSWSKLFATLLAHVTITPLVALVFGAIVKSYM